MSEYTQEHLDAVKNDQTPLVDRLRGNYGGRTFDYVPAIQIVAADALTAKDRQIAELTAKLAVAEKQLDGLLKNAGSIACAIAGYETDLAVRPLREQLAAATARAERAEGVLRGVEWVRNPSRGKVCPSCDTREKFGHAPSCPLAAALAAAGTRGEGEKRDT